MAVQKYTTLSTTAETSESIQLTIIIIIATGIGHHRSEFEQLLRSGGCSKEKPTKAFLSIKPFFAQSVWQFRNCCNVLFSEQGMLFSHCGVYSLALAGKWPLFVTQKGVKEKMSYMGGV